MFFEINATPHVVAVRDSDAVRITAQYEGGALPALRLDLSQRDGEFHCLVALPSLPNDLDEHSAPARIWMRARYEDADNQRRPFTLWVAGFRGGRFVGESRLRLFAGPEEADVSFELHVPPGADRYQIVVYADRQYRGALSLDDIRITAGVEEYRVGPGVHVRTGLARARRWRQDGSRLICSSAYGEHWAEMPPGWRLEAVPGATLAAAEWLLYAELDRQTFGVPAAPPPRSPEPPDTGSAILLHHTASIGSTAALSLLPDETIAFHPHRPYRSFFQASGASAGLRDPEALIERVRRAPNAIMVPTTFELARVAAGGSVGFAHGYGALALGVLLAPHVGAGVIASGALLESAFLGSGHLFADVVALPGSSYNNVRRVMSTAGLELALPVAGCSEVLARQIVDSGRHAGLAFWCSQPSEDGTECGRCFPCFRVLRLRGVESAPEPSESVLRLLDQHPLKSATSLVYAAQRTGYRNPTLDEFREIELGFLERNFEYALHHMLPERLAGHVRRSFEALGVERMTEDDELRLRLIGQTFAPESFSWARAGIPEVASVG